MKKRCSIEPALGDGRGVGGGGETVRKRRSHRRGTNLKCSQVILWLLRDRNCVGDLIVYAMKGCWGKAVRAM